ncbi:MAG: DUF2207 domain-containing protein [Anaerolineae bacterium]|nr:DUF2207 domain-containing protein [Anaerolineae bacterium]
MKPSRLLLLVFFLFALFPLQANAQDRSVTVRQRDADMTINSDGSVNVVETWVVDFQGGPFRFAFRAIPFNRVSSLVFQGVSENGQPYTRADTEEPNTFSVESGSGERTITWYFSPTTDAVRTFQLRYTLSDALRIYDGGDQFWWKFIEADRGYPIHQSVVTVHLPGNFPTDQILAETYTDGSASGGAQIIDGGTVQFTGGPFPPDTEWEIRVQFPHGVVTQSVQPWQRAEDLADAQAEIDAIAAEQFNFYSTVTTWLLLIGGSLSLLLLWYLGGRDRATALPAEFIAEPPQDPPGSGNVLTPALAGTLIDEEANVRDILATLVDWARRGIITITALPAGAKTSDLNDDYVYERIGADAPPLQHQYERELMLKLFRGETSRNIGYIREKFTASRDEMFDALYAELVRLGYFKTRPDHVRAAFYRFGWVLLALLCPAAFLFQIFIGIAYTSGLAFSWSALAPWVVLFILCLALMHLARYMPRKTPQGSQAAARWNAFRRYLERIDKYTNVADAQEQFEKYLPYAVAFGIDKKWVEQFARVDTPAPRWYIPLPSMGIPATRSTRTSGGGRRADPFPSTSSSAGNRETLAGGQARAGGQAQTPVLPTLNDAAGASFNSLNSISAGFFSMLNTTAESFVKSNPSFSPSRGSSRSGSGGRSSWSGGGGGGFRSSGGGGSRGGGGGRSGFG